MEEQETTEHPSLEVTRKRKESPCAKKTETIHDHLKRIREQLERINVIDLTGVQEIVAELKEPLQTIIDQNITIIDLLKSRLDLDAKELELMDIARKKLEKL